MITISVGESKKIEFTESNKTTRRSYSVEVNQSCNHHPSCSSPTSHLTVKNYLCIYVSLRNFMNLKMQMK